MKNPNLSLTAHARTAHGPPGKQVDHENHHKNIQFQLESNKTWKKNRFQGQIGRESRNRGWNWRL